MELKIKLGLFVSSLLFSSLIFADIPNTFEAGSAIKASEMNENFSDLQHQVDLLKSDVESNRLQIDVNSEMSERIDALQDYLLQIESQSQGDERVFVGLTLEATNGNGTFINNGQTYIGLRSMHKRCDVEYSGSRQCSWEEILYSDPTSTQAIVEDSWLRPEIDDEYSCNHFRREEGGNYGYGTAILQSGGDRFEKGFAYCDVARPIACCK